MNVFRVINERQAGIPGALGSLRAADSGTWARAARGCCRTCIPQRAKDDGWREGAVPR